MRTRRKRTRDITPTVRAMIEDLVFMHKASGPDIEDSLKGRVSKGELELIDVPSLRTIQRVIRDLRSANDTDTDVWHLADSEAEDAKIILEVLQTVMLNSEYSKRNFTVKEAKWVVKIARIAPDANPRLIWRIARLYTFYESKGLDTEALDHFMTLRPWRGGMDLFFYRRGVDTGRLPGSPFQSWLLCLDDIALGQDAPKLRRSGFTVDDIKEIAGAETEKVAREAERLETLAGELFPGSASTRKSEADDADDEGEGG